MNKLQKIILALYAAVILVMFLIPPYQRNTLRSNGIVTQDMGYRCIWDAALRGTTNSSSNTVNFQLLGIQMLVATLVAATLWLLTKDGNPLAGWSATKGFSARKTKRTAIAFAVCFILFFVWVLAKGIIRNAGFGLGFIPDTIFLFILIAVWKAIRRTGADSDTEQTGNSSEPRSQSTLKQPFTNAAAQSRPELAELSAFELLAKEKETGFRHEALWLKCFSEAEGNQARAEAAYNRERAAALAGQAREKVISEQRENGIENAPESSAPDQQTTAPHQIPHASKRTSKGLNLIAWILVGLALLFFGSLFQSLPKSQVSEQPAYAPSPAIPASPAPLAIPNVPQASTITEAPMPVSKGSLEHASIEELIPLAEKGNIEAQFVLGLDYLHGIKVPQSNTEAFKWFLKAAEQGEPAAQGNVGAMLHDGQGVKKDGLQALAWWRKAAAQNDLLSQHNLGVSYEFGEDVPQDFSQAFQWYEKAATQGFARSQYNLGCIYRDGRGVAKNDSKAFIWFQKAAEQGNVYAQVDFAGLYLNGQGVAKSVSEAMKWLHKAADSGDPAACYNLGEIFRTGDGVSQSMSEAFNWYQKAAEQGHVPSQARLGSMYTRGEGVQKDAREGLKWLTPLLEKVPLQHDQDNTFALNIIDELAIALNEAGRRKEALEMLRSKSAFSAQAADMLRYEIACLECLNGNFDEAIRLVIKHLQLHPEDKAHAKTDSDLAGIRSVLQNL